MSNVHLALREQWSGWRIWIRVIEIVMTALFLLLVWPLAAWQIGGVLVLIVLVQSISYTEGLYVGRGQ